MMNVKGEMSDAEKKGSACSRTKEMKASECIIQRTGRECSRISSKEWQDHYEL